MQFTCYHIPSGHSVSADITENFEFQRRYGHMNKAEWRKHALELINYWNSAQTQGGKIHYHYTLEVTIS